MPLGTSPARIWGRRQTIEYHEWVLGFKAEQLHLPVKYRHVEVSLFINQVY